MDQSINLFTQSWAVAPPPPPTPFPPYSSTHLLPPAPIPLLFPRVGDKCLTEAIRAARALTDMRRRDTQPRH